MTIAAEVQQNTDTRELREALEAEADRLVVDVAIMPA
jgi:predicted amino acid-binding ACT domain protein